MLTISEFTRATGISDELAGKWFSVITAAMQKYGISTPLRQAHFLAQVGHESTGFTRVEEGLNYSAKALLSMFPKRITPAQADKYGRTDKHLADTQMIANIIYANRNGNSDIASGDGYRYRGRGLIQITGKANYAALVKQLGRDIVSQPGLLTGYALAAESAAAWWKNNGLNAIADSDDVTRITKIVNGGDNGLEDRKARLLKAKGVLCSG